VTKKRVHYNSIIGYSIALITGILVGFRISPQFIAVPYVLLSIVCLYFAFQNDIRMVLSILPYLIYTEIFIRAYVLIVPYLYLQYLFIVVFGVLILRSGGKVKLHSRTFVFLFLFMLIELINTTRSDAPDISRSLVTNDLVLVIIALWSSFSIVKPVLANKILNNIKYAGIYLCGIVIARYLVGDVLFSGYSASEGTNGLAPVQISGYLGFSCTVFFFSIMNDQERRNLLLNLVLFSITAIIMLLSFSRGGLYFLGILMFFYFLFNRTQVKSYFLFLLLIPVGLLIYYYVSKKTHGLIVERYQEEGSSGRDRLIEAGWTLFKSEPLAGVGTGNFNSEIKKLGLYTVESGAHNEFIRVAAEDGILGIIAYGCFYILLFYEILRRSGIRREYAIYFLLFFCLINVHNGLKISLQPLLLILAVATPNLVSVKKKKNVSDSKKFAIGFEEN
jgi:O-antigen ligase